METPIIDQKKIHILLVEDEEAHSELISRAFEDEGSAYNLIIASSLLEAQSFIKTIQPDLVITDWLLPDGKGIELLPEDKEQLQFPIVVMTSHGNEKLAVEAMKAGALDYVVKSQETLADMPHIAERSIREWEHMTKRKRAEEKVRLDHKVFESTSEAIIITDDKTNIIDVNQAFTTITGYNKEEVIGRNLQIVIAKDHKDELKKIWREVLRNAKWQGEVWERRKDGESYPIWLTLNMIKNDKNEISNFLAIFSDISTIKQTQERLHYLANYDSLTNLPNRVLFRDRLQQSLHQAERNGYNVVLMFLDLDHFKKINDTLKHHIGDLLLQEVADRLVHSARKSDTVARLAGDEFTIFFTEVSPTQNIAKIAQKLLDALSQPFILETHEVYITSSIGIAMYPDDGNNIDVLLKNADTAMYHAKRMGRNNFQFYSKEMNIKTLEQLQMEVNLRRSLERKEFHLLYQPKIDFSSGKIVGVEALLRWESNQFGLVLPNQFIPIAEETGLIVPIGEWVLKMACHQTRKWQLAGYDTLRISINLSPIQFKQKNLVNVITKLLEDIQLEPKYLVLELTESMIMQEIEFSIMTLIKLKAMGVQIAVDDFGTGYSSLSYLKRFPIDILKIDKTFVHDILDSPDDAAIVEAIISMGHSLKMRVIAEGVETEDHYAFLKMHNCDEGQGYYFTKPVLPDEMSELLSKGAVFG